jgi:hypothetical protein
MRPGLHQSIIDGSMLRVGPVRNSMILVYEIVSLTHLAGCFGAHSMVMRKALVYSRRKNGVALLVLNIQSELCP